MNTVIYAHQRVYLGNRPYSNITLLGGCGNPSVNFSALVDTGADYLQLPLSAAVTAGINIRRGRNKIVHGATGTAYLLFMTGIKIEVESKVVVVDVLFDPTNSSSALLGRQCLLAAVDAGFNAKEWLWEY